MSTRHSWNPRAITPKKCRCFANTFFSSVISFGDESKASLISLFKGTTAQLGTITSKVAILFQYIHLCLFTNYLWQIHCSSMIHTCHENWINTYLVITERSLKIIFIQKLFELTVVAYALSMTLELYTKLYIPSTINSS